MVCTERYNVQKMYHLQTHSAAGTLQTANLLGNLFSSVIQVTTQEPNGPLNDGYPGPLIGTIIGSIAGITCMISIVAAVIGAVCYNRSQVKKTKYVPILIKIIIRILLS